MAIETLKNVNFGLPQRVKATNFWGWAILLVIFGGLFYWFLVIPKQDQVSAKQSDLDKLQQTASSTRENLSKIQKLSAELTADKDQVAKLDQALPLELNVPRLQIFMNNLAKSVNVSVGDITISSRDGTILSGNKALLSKPFSVARTVQPLATTIYVIGSFPNVEAFLRKLENSGRIMDVSDLAMDSAGNGNLNLKISLKAYYFAPSQ